VQLTVPDDALTAILFPAEMLVELIVRTPVPMCWTPTPFEVLGTVILPLTDAELVDDKLSPALPEVPVNTFADRVTPSDNAKVPPTVAPPVISLRTSATVVLILTVIAKLFAISTSPLAKVTAAAVPVGVVAQTSDALIFPALRAK
tara:strand:- start:36 stop:473 length:438 start_codon:yes stop_codon:yes gene_type:complete